MTRWLQNSVGTLWLAALALVLVAGLVVAVAARWWDRDRLRGPTGRRPGWWLALVSVALVALGIGVAGRWSDGGPSAVYTKPQWNQGPVLSADLQRAVTPSNRGETRKVFVHQGPDDHSGSQHASTTLLVTLRANRAETPEELKQSILEDSRRIMDAVFGRPAYRKWQAVSVGATYPTTRTGEQTVASVTLTRDQYEAVTADGRLDRHELAQRATITWLPPLGPGDRRGTGELRWMKPDR